MHYRNRYYSTQLGTFVSRDPIGVAAGTHLYAYAGSAPVNRVDPTGLIFVGSDRCLTCIPAFDRCNRFAGTDYAACTSVIGVGAILEFSVCLGVCSKIYSRSRWMISACTVSCTAGTVIITGLLTLPHCNLALIQARNMCGADYNYCARHLANRNDCGCGPGEENWRPDPHDPMPY